MSGGNDEVLAGYRLEYEELYQSKLVFIKHCKVGSRIFKRLSNNRMGLRTR